MSDTASTLTDESKDESGTESATGNGINLVVSAINSLGESSGNGDVDQITVIAPGGEITINSPRADNPDDNERPHGTIVVFTAKSDNNSSSQSEDGVTKNTALGDAAAQARADAIQGTMHITVNKADDEPGTVDVYVILSGDGAAITETVTLTFTGPNESLAVGEPTETLLAFGEVTELPDVLRRDIIALSLSATDAGGNAGPVPDVRIRILDPAGKVVNSEKIESDQIANSAKVPNTVLKLTSKPSSLTPLDAGAYTVRVSSAGGLSSEGIFEVVGRADNVELSVDVSSPSGVGELVSATATVTSDGADVPNGTIVTFNASDVSGDGDSVLVAVGSGKTQRAFGGVATATFVTVGSGSSVVSATAHRTTDVEVIISTAGAADADAASEAVSLDCLSATNGFATYTCGTDSSASELFGLVSGRGASAIHLWNGSDWVRYSVVDGAMVPGSSDFTVTDNDILYISN